MELNKARNIVNNLIDKLKPYCDRIEIAGSIRREKPEVKDMEIVCIPTEIDGERNPEFIRIVNELEKVKGDISTCKYTQRITPEGIKLDLFIANKKNWGMIFAVRTGSADFSHHVLAKGWVKKGYHSKNAMLIKNDIEYPLLEEKDVFDIIGIPYVEPTERNYEH